MSSRREILEDAVAKARRLVAELEADAAQLAAGSSNLSPDKLAEGRQAVAAALVAARRLLQALQDSADREGGEPKAS